MTDAQTEVKTKPPLKPEAQALVDQALQAGNKAITANQEARMTGENKAVTAANQPGSEILTSTRNPENDDRKMLNDVPPEGMTQELFEALKTINAYDLYDKQVVDLSQEELQMVLHEIIGDDEAQDVIPPFWSDPTSIQRITQQAESIKNSFYTIDGKNTQELS